MAWLPWARIPMRSNMTTGEVVAWLRYRAIDFGAPSAFIDAIDDLGLSETAQEELETLREELHTAQLERTALKDALASLVSDPADRKRLDVAREVLEELEG